ncbi:hypothetical protein H2200_006871 [Cladophialophora chaetospira]|uniref:Uncharacterized protein n=1 Tax=Cladophialophora chaetospira TaxID=386627 RepID=A0AA38X962_9EURO|nr:hypothetical protein H2200_006871 [Cladophialophora chaetospira]
MAMIKIEDHMINEHPAVRSGPSSNPTKQLLGMPDEIRLQIYRAFLVKDGNVKLKCEYQPDAIRWTKSLSVNKGVTAFLRTCEKIKIEGTDVLYGDNTFECYHVRVFKNEFIHGKSFERSDKFRGIGKENASKIKRGYFGLPLVIIRNPQDSWEGNPFLDFMCTDLVGLQKLTITTMISSRVGGQAEDKQADRTRALTTTAARIAKYHPTLRKPIWRHWSGHKYEEGYDEQYVWGEFFVDIMAPGFEMHLDGTTPKLDAFGRNFEACDVLLKTAMILRTPWLQINIWRNIKNFELSQKYLTSEVDASEIATWPGEFDWESDDQAALVEVSKSRCIHGKFTSGRFVDGKFIKGCWFDGDTSFVQGKWINARHVEGKYDYGQFVGDEWVTDTHFVEGKWVDGKLIKGVWIDWREGKFLEGTWRDGLFVKGRWSGEQFVEGKTIGKLFYPGKWASNETFTQGAWTQQPKVAELSPLEGWWSKLGGKGTAEGGSTDA